MKLAAFLYIFSMFNREFVPFVDLRVLVFVLFVFLILNPKNIINFLSGKGILIYSNKNGLLLFLVFVFMIFVSNITWFFNILEINLGIFLKIISLYAYGIISIVFFRLYGSQISRGFVLFSVWFSCIFLLISIIFHAIGFTNLPFGQEIRPVRWEELSPLGIRVGGYAEDPNYAALNMILWFAITFSLSKNFLLRFLALVFSMVGFLLSFSKTLFACIVIFISFVFGGRRMLLFILTFVIFLVMFWVVFVHTFNIFGLTTLLIRFKFLSATLESIYENLHFFLLWGMGISSVRSNLEHRGFWYVHPHNGYITLLHDHGLWFFVLFFVFLVRLLRIRDVYYLLLLFVVNFLLLTQDIFVNAHVYFVFGVLPIWVERQRVTRFKL